MRQMSAEASLSSLCLLFVRAGARRSRHVSIACHSRQASRRARPCLPACSSPATPGVYRCCAHVQVVPTVLDLEDVNYGPGGGYYGS